MYFTEIMLRAAGASFRSLSLLLLLAACASSPVHAQATAGQAQNATTDAKPQSAIENLANIQRSIELKRATVRELREQLKQQEDPSEKQALEQKIERINKDLTSLQLAFENIALGGINQSILEDQPEQKIDWQVEIEEVSRPLLSTLKELTAKPRQIDSLRRELDRQEDQLKVINKALESIHSFSKQSLPPVAAEPVNRLLLDWEQRRDDTQRALEITRFKLTSLKTETTAWYTSAKGALADFLRGRGLTLLLAIIASVAVWLIAKGLLWLYWRWLFQARQDIGIARAPLVYYSYRLATAILIVLAILMVFYVRGDVLFLTLALIALAGAALTLRQTLPRYTAELRLLLGVGPVRENERLVLDGIPFIVESLSVYSVLRNPALEGVVRLPLHVINAHASRPAATQEPWFPCQPGDYVLLADGSFGLVLRQTIELVELAIRDSKVQIPSRDFLAQCVRNLSFEKFGVASTFGIDYQHQAICLDTVPERFREAVVARFEHAGLKDAIEDLLVEFREAGASSLDYQIYLILNGRAAKAYFRAQRMIQQACVETCNREGWVIPFTQITVHSGDGAAGPGEPGDHLSSGETRLAAASSQKPA
jgi:small-conductance mechanosensitive channel